MELSQAQFALYMGVSGRSVVRWEKGQGLIGEWKKRMEALEWKLGGGGVPYWICLPLKDIQEGKYFEWILEHRSLQQRLLLLHEWIVEKECERLSGAFHV